MRVVMPASRDTTAWLRAPPAQQNEDGQLWIVDDGTAQLWTVDEGRGPAAPDEAAGRDAV